MSKYRYCCVYLLLTSFTAQSPGTEIIYKSVCLGDSIKAFENNRIASHNAVFLLHRNYAFIALWDVTNGSLRRTVIQPGYDKKLFRDDDGNIWIQNVNLSDEADYVIQYDSDGSSRTSSVQIVVMVAPSISCRPQIKRVGNDLVASLGDNNCGKPTASLYWLGYINQTVLPLLPGNEAGVYHACIEGPSITCARSKATHHCASFKIDADVELAPKICLVQRNITDISIVLQCQSNLKSSGRFRWRRNGFPINGSHKYVQKGNSLSIRYLNADDQYDIYTCVESGSRFESDPYSIEMSGPTAINVTHNIMMVKEYDEMNVSCLARCYPLCSVEWSKLDTSLGQWKILSEDGTLQVTNVTRKMSGNYSCKVRNLITGSFLEWFLSLDVIYGPDYICLNGSNTIIVVNKFDSVSIPCTAECFPPCLIGWTETYTGTPLFHTELRLNNVTANASYTCHATNPKMDTAKISKTITIQVKIDETPIPGITIVKHNASDSSIVLQCLLSRIYTGKFYWMVNGSIINDSARYSEDNNFLTVKHVTAEDQYDSYTCEEHERRIRSKPFSIKAHGPEKVVLNRSDTIVEVDRISSVTLFCSAHCFPPCLFKWTFSYTDAIIEGAVIEVVNVTSDFSLTCHATNPININATASGTIDIIVKSENVRDTTSSTKQNQNAETTSKHIPPSHTLMYIIPGLAGIGLAVAVVTCFRKKLIHCLRVDGLSNNNHVAHANAVSGGESLRGETLSEHYWTIATNARGELSTALDRNINVEFNPFIGLVHLDVIEPAESIRPSHQHPEELKELTPSFNLASTEIKGSYSDSLEHIDLVRTRRSEYIHPIHSDDMECNEYIHPIISDDVELDGSPNSIPSDSMGLTRSVLPVPLYHEGRDGYIDVIPSKQLASNIYVDTISLD